MWVGTLLATQNLTSQGSNPDLLDGRSFSNCWANPFHYNPISLESLWITQVIIKHHPVLLFFRSWTYLASTLHSSRPSNWTTSSKSMKWMQFQFVFVALFIFCLLVCCWPLSISHFQILFKSHWCQDFEPAFASYFKILEEASTFPNPQFFDSLRKCFMPTYITEALTNGTKNINELYEFNGNAFDGGYQAQVYRGKLIAVISSHMQSKWWNRIFSPKGRHIESGRPVVLKVSSRVSLRPDYEAYRQIGITEPFSAQYYLYVERQFLYRCSRCEHHTPEYSTTVRVRDTRWKGSHCADWCGWKSLRIDWREEIELALGLSKSYGPFGKKSSCLRFFE